MSFVARNHPQQVASRGALLDVDDRAVYPDDFARFDAKFGPFTLDAAANAANAKCPFYFTPGGENDGLTNSWAGWNVWCNPPFSNIRPWVEKAWREYVRCQAITMLLPANRCEQKWWQELVEPHRDIGGPLRCYFLPNRMRFIRPGAVIGPKGDRPPFGCLLLHWSSP